MINEVRTRGYRLQVYLAFGSVSSPGFGRARLRLRLRVKDRI